MAVTASALQLITTLTGGAVELATSVTEARALKARGRAEARSMEFQAGIAARQAADVERQGMLGAGQEERFAQRFAASQRVAAAAQGISLGDDVARLQSMSRESGGDLANTIRNTASRQALGIELTKEDLLFGARRARRGGLVAARSTLLTGGLSFIREAQSGFAEFSKDPRFFKGRTKKITPHVGPEGPFIPKGMILK